MKFNTIFLAGTITAICWVNGHAGAREEEDHELYPALLRTEKSPVFWDLAMAGFQTKYSPNIPDGGWIRLELGPASGLDTPKQRTWRATILSGVTDPPTEIQTLSSKGPGTLYSEVILSSLIVLRVPNGSADIKIYSIEKSKSPHKFDSQIGSKFSNFAIDDSANVNETKRNRAKGVALLHFKAICKDENGNISTKPVDCYCTGFLIAEDLLLTARHCIKTNRIAESAKITFDYHSRKTAYQPVIGTKKLNSTEYFHRNRKLDISVLRLREQPSAAKERILKFSNISPNVGEPLYVIHHYLGGEALVSYDDQCRIYNIHEVGFRADTRSDTDFSHGCDTDPRSSGSPVFFLKTDTIAGLHNRGRGPKSKKDCFKNSCNQGITSVAILQHLRTQKFWTDRNRAN